MGAHDRVAALAPRVRELLRQWTGAAAVDMAATTAVPAEAAAASATRPPAEPSPAGESSKPSLDELSAFGLLPLRAVPTDPVPVGLDGCGAEVEGGTRAVGTPGGGSGDPGGPP